MKSLRTCQGCVFRISSQATGATLEYLETPATTHFTHRFRGKVCGPEAGAEPEEEAGGAAYPALTAMNRCTRRLASEVARCGRDGGQCSRTDAKNLFLLANRCKAMIRKIDAEQTL